jgi:hypothetical protein
MRADRTKAAAAVRAPLSIHTEPLRQQPSPRNPVPVRAAITVAFISVLIFNGRQLDRLRHHLRP